MCNVPDTYCRENWLHVPMCVGHISGKSTVNWQKVMDLLAVFEKPRHVSMAPDGLAPTR